MTSNLSIQWSKLDDGIFISDSRGNTWVITPHLVHGIAIATVGASLIPYCLELAQRRDLCDRWTAEEAARIHASTKVELPEEDSPATPEGAPSTPSSLMYGRVHLPTGEPITKLPFEAPWMSGLGMGIIKICALRIEAGVIQACLADQSGVPYRQEGQRIWYPVSDFPNEWPQ